MIQQALSEISGQIRIRPRYDNFIGVSWHVVIPNQSKSA